MTTIRSGGNAVSFAWAEAPAVGQPTLLSHTVALLLETDTAVFVLPAHAGIQT